MKSSSNRHACVRGCAARPNCADAPVRHEYRFRVAQGSAESAREDLGSERSHCKLVCVRHTVLELETGVLQVELRDPRQGAPLRSWLDAQVMPAFGDRVLPIDTAVALRCARLHVPDRMAHGDALIAATALVHGLTVVTRNTDDFKSAGVELLDPVAGAGLTCDAQGEKRRCACAQLA